MVKPKMSESLMKPLTEQEVLRAIAFTDATCWAREDGLTKHFHIDFWDVMNEPFGFSSFFISSVYQNQCAFWFIALI